MFTLNQQISILRNDLNNLKINSGDFSGGIIEYTIDTISSLDEKVDSLNIDFISLSGSVDNIITNATSLSGSVDTIINNATSLSGSVDSIITNVTSLSGSVDTTITNVTSLSGSVDTITTNVTSLSGSVDTIISNVTSLSGSADTLINNVANLQIYKQNTIIGTTDISLNDLRVLGNLTVDGSFNINNIIQNDITINNEILISTQLDISNQGTGPALKVSQFGSGDQEHVAIFNAGEEEGDALLIDSSGDITIYKSLNVIGDVIMNSINVTNLIGDKIAISMDICNNYALSISGDIYLNGKIYDNSGNEYIGTSDGTGSNVFTAGDNITIVDERVSTTSNITLSNGYLYELAKILAIYRSISSVSEDTIILDVSFDQTSIINTTFFERSGTTIVIVKVAGKYKFDVTVNWVNSIDDTPRSIWTLLMVNDAYKHEAGNIVQMSNNTTDKFATSNISYTLDLNDNDQIKVRCLMQEDDSNFDNSFTNIYMRDNTALLVEFVGT